MDGTEPSDNLTDGSISKMGGPTTIIEWNIADYKSLFQARKFGAIAKSPNFEMRKAVWSFQISHLLSTLGEKLVTVYLFRHQSEIRYHSITLLVAVQVNEKEICGGYRKSYIFGKSDELCNIALKEKELLQRMNTDAVTVLCTIFPETETRRPDSLSMDSNVMSASNSFIGDEGTELLSSHIKNLFDSGENSDFVMKVKGREFHVHKAILSARSPVLSAMLHHDMAEKHSNTTEIVDCEPESFCEFLLYLYSGRVEKLSWDTVVSLYVLGDKYDLEHLRKLCLEFIEGNLCVEMFCDAISLAVKYNELALLEFAEDYFLENVKSILVTNRWQLLMQENPIICNELFLKCYK